MPELGAYMRGMKAPSFTHVLSAALVALLVLTGQAAASARGQTAAAGQIVICSGHGPVTIYVDETGAPTGPPHLCPDCALGLLSMPLPPAFAIMQAEMTWTQVSIYVAQVLTVSRPHHPTTRGPPWTV